MGVDRCADESLGTGEDKLFAASVTVDSVGFFDTE